MAKNKIKFNQRKHWLLSTPKRHLSIKEKYAQNFYLAKDDESIHIVQELKWWYRICIIPAMLALLTAESIKLLLIGLKQLCTKKLVRVEKIHCSRAERADREFFNDV